MNSGLLSGRVLFGGYYGMDNVGDNCFGSVLTWGARNYWGSREVLLLSRKEVTGPVRTRPACSAAPFFRGQFVLESYWQILRSSCVIWGGGSIFPAIPPAFTPKQISFLASRFGITAAGAIGVSLGPYRSAAAERQVHASLANLKFLTLRDRASFEEAATLDLPYQPVLAADLAMLLPKMYPSCRQRNNDRPILGVTVCHYERYKNQSRENEARRERTMLEAVQKLVAAGFRGTVRLFVFNNHPLNGDEAITREFYSCLKNSGADVELVSYDIDPIAIYEKVAGCTAMISTRLHGAIYAAAANVPCCLVEYHRKCTDFVSDIGVADKWLIGDADCSSDVLSDKLMDLLLCEESNFYSLRDHLIAMAERNFTFPEGSFCRRGEK